MIDIEIPPELVFPEEVIRNLAWFKKNAPSAFEAFVAMAVFAFQQGQESVRENKT